MPFETPTQKPTKKPIVNDKTVRHNKSEHCIVSMITIRKKKKKKKKTKKNPYRFGRNHFIEKENQDLGKNDEIGDFRLRMTKKLSLIAIEKGLKGRTKGGTIRVSRETREV